MNNLRDLIVRLEKTREPDREVDYDILRIINPDQYANAERIAKTKLKEAEANGLTDREEACYRYAFAFTPNYTSSVDDARKLLPWDKHPGAELHVRMVQSGYGDFYAFVEFTWPSTERQGRARTEPVATCIAALLAVEETDRQMAPYRGRAALKTAQ